MHLIYSVNTVCMFFIALYCILLVLYLQMDIVQAKQVMVLKSEM